MKTITDWVRRAITTPAMITEHRDRVATMRAVVILIHTDE